MNKSWLLLVICALGEIPEYANAASPGDGGQVAGDACFCKQFEDRLGLHSLANDVSEIGLRALHPEGHALQSWRGGDSSYQLKLSADEMIPAVCRKYVVSKRRDLRPSIILRGVIGGDAPLFMTSDSGVQDLIDIHNNIYEQKYNQCPWPNTAADVPAYQTCLTKNASGQFAKYSQDVYSGTPEQVLSRLLALGESGVTLSQAKILKAYNQEILNGGTEAQVLAAVTHRSDGLSNQEFLVLIKMFGLRMHMDYDHVRLAKWSTAQGGVGGDLLLNAARNNEQSGITWIGKTDIGYGVADFEGVCRDIASFQAKLLRARGFHNSFVVGFQKTDGVMHATLLTQDPEHPNVIYQYNYSTSSERKNLDGAANLFQGGNDFTTNYRVFAPDGRMVANVPSEMGKFLQEVAGGNVLDLDHGARVTSSLLAANLMLSKNGNYQVRAVSGRESQGGIYNGAAADVRYADESALGMAPGRIGVFIGDQYRRRRNFGNDTDNNQLLLYAQAEQHLKSPDIHLAKGLVLVVDHTLLLNATLGYAVDGVDHGKLSAQGDARANAEVKLDYRTPESRFHAQVRAGVQVSPSLTDVRNDQSIGIAFNQAYFDALATLKVKNVTLLLDTLAVVDQIGSRGRLEAGIAARKVAVTGTLSGKLTSRTPQIQDGSIRRAGLNILYKPVEGVTLGLTGEVPVEGDDILGRTQIMGNFGLGY